MPPRTLIKDLQPNQFLEGVFSIQNCQLGQTKNGKPYIKCLLGDKSGRLPGRMWNANEEMFSGLPTDGFVYLEGQTQPYQGEIQIIINTLYGIDPTPQDIIDLMPCTSRDIDLMFTQVQAYLNDLTNPSLKALAQAYLDDQPLMTQFKQAPAAMMLHHAYIGGLLEHTLNLMDLAKSVCPLYPAINRELVMLGLFIHDLGKCQELSWVNGFGYTDDGQLVGHIARGAIWLEQKAQAAAARGTPISAATLMVLQHIVLSHHGKAEFGALKVPATPEAILVSLLDNLDAKMQMAVTARGDLSKPLPGGAFSEKVFGLETKVYRPDPTAPPLK